MDELTAGDAPVKPEVFNKYRKEEPTVRGVREKNTTPNRRKARRAASEKQGTFHMICIPLFTYALSPKIKSQRTGKNFRAIQTWF